MSARRLWVRTAALLALAPAVAFAQVQPQSATPPAGMLTPSTTNAAAVTELRAALDDQFMWGFGAARVKAGRAVEMEPTFGLARAIQAWMVGGPTAAAESQRAAGEAAAGTATEAVLSLAIREQLAGRGANARRLYQVATELAPNDRAVAMLRALQLTDTARVTAFRALASRYPDYAAPRTILAITLTPMGLDSIIRANSAEAMSVAGEAIRLAPQTAASHTALAHVLLAQGNIPEAQQHLMAATSFTPRSSYTYELLAQTYAVEGKFADVRSALDSASALSGSVPNQFFYRRPRALTFMSEGNPARAMAELELQVKDAEAINARGQQVQARLWMALVSAGSRDSAAAERHLAVARTLEPAAAALADNETIVYSLIGNATSARRALGDYIRLSGPQPNLSAAVNATRTENVHRMTGLVLLAEKKPQEAIAELRQGGTNPYATLGIIEAYKLQRNNKQADAERAAFFQRRQFSFNSSATPIIRYRATVKK